VLGNVLQLFKIENPPDPKTITAIAVASILSSKDRLARAVEELSKHLDAVGRTIDALSDTDPQTWVMHAAKLNSERLAKAMLELSQAAEKLSAIQQELAEAVARCTGQAIN
jgi:methyl-accepting chemotaxis protein